MPSALISCLWAWCSMVLSPLQHRGGSSLTVSVRPRAELKRIRRTPEVRWAWTEDTGFWRLRLPGGERPSWLVSCFTSSSIHPSHWLPEAGLPAPTGVQYHTHGACAPVLFLCGPQGARSYPVGKHHTKRQKFILFLCPVPRGGHTQRQASECCRVGRAPPRAAGKPWEGRALLRVNSVS